MYGRIREGKSTSVNGSALDLLLKLCEVAIKFEQKQLADIYCHTAIGHIQDREDHNFKSELGTSTYTKVAGYLASLCHTESAINYYHKAVQHWKQKANCDIKEYGVISVDCMIRIRGILTEVVEIDVRKAVELYKNIDTAYFQDNSNSGQKYKNFLNKLWKEIEKSKVQLEADNQNNNDPDNNQIIDPSENVGLSGEDLSNQIQDL